MTTEAKASDDAIDGLKPEWYRDILPKHSTSFEILHFNDVYNLEGKVPSKDPVEAETQILRGCARFKTAFDRYNSKGKLVVFSGDVFSPAIRK